MKYYYNKEVCQLTGRSTVTLLKKLGDGFYYYSGQDSEWRYGRKTLDKFLLKKFSLISKDYADLLLSTRLPGEHYCKGWLLNWGDLITGINC